MTRIRRRTLFDLEFVAATPLHVGTGRGSVVADAELARDAAGNLLVPGTSLAGVLRARCESLFEGPVTEQLFGRMARRDAPGWASRVTVGDATVKLPVAASAVLIQGVGIDRISGTAAERFLYDRRVLPAGTRLVTSLEVVDTEVVDAEPDRLTGVHARRIAQLLETVLPEVASSLDEPTPTGDGPEAARPSRGRRQPLLVGASTARGLGQVRLDVELSTCHEVRYEAATLVSDLLDAPASRPLHTVLPAGDHRDDTGLHVRIGWQATGPLMVRGTHDSVVDAVPRFGFDGRAFAPTLPGASIKGALRTAAERIVRTVRPDIDTVDPVAEGDPARFTDQIDVPLVRDLFGTAKTRDGGRQGALIVSDLFATSPRHRFETWEQVQELLSDPDASDRHAWFQHAMHVAIDRFTGGAADRLLFDALEPHGVTWPDIELRVDTARLVSSEDPWAAVGLLLLVVQEFAAGLIPLGAFAERGAGDVRVSEVHIEGSGEVVGASSVGSGAAAEPPSGWSCPPDVWNRATDGWRRWVTASAQGAE